MIAELLMGFKLFFIFMKTSFCCFGGMAMIPLIYEELVDGGLMSASEFSDIIAIAEMTPGSFSINSATFVGLRMGSVLTAFLATLGNMIPSLTLCLIVAVFVEKFRSSKAMQKILYGVRPVAVGMLATAAIVLFQSNYFVSAGILDIKCLLIGCICLAVLLTGKISITKTIGIAALLGLCIPSIPLG